MRLPHPMLSCLLLPFIVTTLPGQQATGSAEPFLQWARATATPIATATPRADVSDLAGLKGVV